jgi:hypothetical protein
MSSQFRNILILEHPVIYVFLPTETPDFDIEKHAMPELKKVRDAGPSNQYNDSLAGVPASRCSVYKEQGEPASKCSVYKEEEIEEGEMESETCIVDLSEHAAQNSKFGGGKRLLP